MLKLNVLYNAVYLSRSIRPNKYPKIEFEIESKVRHSLLYIPLPFERQIQTSLRTWLCECNQSAKFKHICLCGGCITADSWPSFINQAWIKLMSHVTSRVLRVLLSLALAHENAFTAVQIQFFPIPLIRMHIFVLFGRCVNTPAETTWVFPVRWMRQSRRCGSFFRLIASSSQTGVVAILFTIFKPSL